MNKTAASHDLFDFRIGVALIGALSAGVLLLAAFASAAAARPLARDGQIHACYRVKGKPKGELRVVASARAHCRRGERKVAWSAAGSSGFQGTSSQGAQGAAGQPGANGSAAPDDAALKAQVGALALRVQALEGANEALCKQSETLTKQINLVAGVVEGLGLNGALTTLGGLLVVPALPAALPAFNCPTS